MHNTHTNMPTYIQNMHTYMCMHRHTYMPTYIHTYRHTYAQTYMHTYKMRTCIQKYIYI